MSEPVPATPQPPGGARAWLVWAIAVTFVVYYFSFQTGYSIVNANVQKDVGLDIAQVGIIAAAYTWLFAIFQFLSGPLLDRFGARRVLLPAIVLVTVGILIFSRAHSFEALLLSQLIIALGACAGFVGAGYVGGTWFGWAKFSFMFGLVQFAASLFSAFNQNLIGHALTLVDWRQLFLWIGASGTALFTVAWLWLRDPTLPAPVIIGESFISGVARALLAVARHRHVWIAAAFGSLCFGAMLSLGVVWAPKLLAVRGLDTDSANLGASLLWLGLAAGCFIAPWASDRLRRRKLPALIGIAIQIVALGLLLYTPPLGPGDFILCFVFGFGNSAHMLAFSTAADVVDSQYIGTSAACVNGLMFIVGGLMISRPGMRIGVGIESGLLPNSLDLARYASLPLFAGICVAFVIVMLMRETYPLRPGLTAQVSSNDR